MYCNAVLVLCRYYVEITIRYCVDTVYVDKVNTM